jgi:MoxR-like ATPase
MAGSTFRSGGGTPEPGGRTPAEAIERAMFEMKRIIVGQDRVIERLFVALIARGHCLLEGAPGLAKTLAAETLATVVGGTFSCWPTRSTGPRPRCSRRCSRSWPSTTCRSAA